YASLIGNMQAIEAIKIITGMSIPMIGELITFDLEKNNLHRFYNPEVMPPHLHTSDFENNSDYSISIKDLQKSIVSNDIFTILDIRDKDKFDDNCIDGAICCSAEKILEEGLDHFSTTKILLICDEGTISALLANAMNQHSKDVFYLEGGMQAWTHKP
ncbi:MAG: rhodanese-like domain-containing protein, partial [Verrucomicrobiota bacterium]|nr:rhodanese-like domain-containing protein [Verrucomicrobiota bacterium]